MIYFLDANIISYLLKGNTSVLKKLEELAEDDDIFIGATALENNAILVTNNKRHLGRIKDLKIEVWN